MMMMIIIPFPVIFLSFISFCIFDIFVCSNIDKNFFILLRVNSFDYMTGLQNEIKINQTFHFHSSETTLFDINLHYVLLFLFREQKIMRSSHCMPASLYWGVDKVQL